MAKKFRQRENTASLTKQMLGIEEPQETEESERVLPAEESRTPSSEGLLSTHFQEQQKANENVNAYMQDFNEEQNQILKDMAKQLYDEPIPDKSQFMDELLKDYHSLREKEQHFEATDNENTYSDSKPKENKTLKKKFKRTKRVQILITEQLYDMLKETSEINDTSMNELINQCIEKFFYE